MGSRDSGIKQTSAPLPTGSGVRVHDALQRSSCNSHNAGVINSRRNQCPTNLGSGLGLGETLPRPELIKETQDVGTNQGQ